jgi:hypothetical protein
MATTNFTYLIFEIIVTKVDNYQTFISYLKDISQLLKFCCKIQAGTSTGAYNFSFLTCTSSLAPITGPVLCKYSTDSDK